MILKDERSGLKHRVSPDGVRLGRDPELEVVFPESEDVVSALHARVLQREGEWWLDLGSTNGTWVNGQRIAAPVRLTTGSRFSLGQRGPAFRVTIPGQIARTQAEPAIDLSQPGLRLRRVKGGEDLVATGTEILIGRGAGCTISLRTVADTVVSKRQAVVTIHDDGAFIQDLGSRNGSFLNGQPVRARTPITLGDKLMLGWQGPVFEVRMAGHRAMAEGEGAPYQPRREPPKTLSGMVAIAGERARDETGVRPGVFVSTMARQMVSESSVMFRVVTLLMFAGITVSVALLFRASTRRAAAAEARFASAQNLLTQQLHEETEARKLASQEIDRLRQQLDAARRSSVSRGAVDSLERRLREAESLAVAPPSAPIPSGAPFDWTAIAQQNGRAVGLVIARYASDSIMGSGFVVTPSGYFITNRHVVHDTTRGDARQIYVVMAETNTALPADLANVSSIGTQDVAVLRIHGFRGVTVRSIDWSGRGTQQGSPALIIGFPLGIQIAADQSGYVKTTVFAGVIAGQTGDWLRFSGPTYSGVSGSPVFNARGEVIALHFGVPREAIGMGLSIPMSKVKRWLPNDAKAELGL